MKRVVTVSLLDYGAGNVRSVRNALVAAAEMLHGSGDGDGVEYNIIDIDSPDQIETAEMIVFPGVGSFGSAMSVLHEKGYDAALKRYLSKHDRPYLGICLGMQTLFEASEETSMSETHDSNDISSAQQPEQPEQKLLPGLGVIPGNVVKFDKTAMAVPHIGWNGRVLHPNSNSNSPVFKYLTTSVGSDGQISESSSDGCCYFVHSYYAPIVDGVNDDWILTSTTYSGQRFISSIQKGAVVATQFHPEKSGLTGLNIIRGFLEAAANGTLSGTNNVNSSSSLPLLRTTVLTKRIVVALDVRTNDDGDLVVTKGDQYDVREQHDDNENNNPALIASNEPSSILDNHGTTRDSTTSTTKKTKKVRNLGKPVSLARRYYEEGADEIAFLNITSFRSGVMEDMPMLHLLEEASKHIFVPLTVGGGIRSYTDPETQQTWSALQVAARYFRAGADKVSIGSDAVDAAEAYIKSNGQKSGTTSIEMISRVYGAQAVVISIDPRRVYVSNDQERNDASRNGHVVVELDADQLGPNGERYCWYQCTVKGGREGRNICAVTVATSCQALGAGEIMLNCIDMDGQCNGYDIALMRTVANAVSIPIIASSGAGIPQHFVNVFQQTSVQAALAAGMFHRKEYEIQQVKHVLQLSNIPTRM